MPQRAAHGAEARCMIAGAEAAVWTERMLSALVNGVKGGKKKRPRPQSAVAQCLLRRARAVRTSPSLGRCETASMKKPPTGEPYAGKPPVRFGGRGGASHPDPYPLEAVLRRYRNSWIGAIRLAPIAPYNPPPAPVVGHGVGELQRERADRAGSHDGRHGAHVRLAVGRQILGRRG